MSLTHSNATNQFNLIPFSTTVVEVVTFPNKTVDSKGKCKMTFSNESTFLDYWKYREIRVKSLYNLNQQKINYII